MKCDEIKKKKIQNIIIFPVFAPTESTGIFRPCSFNLVRIEDKKVYSRQ